MIYTSYYAKARYIKNAILVQISNSAPMNVDYTIRPAIPAWSIVSAHKNKQITNEQYTERYIADTDFVAVKAKLDAIQATNKDKDIILLCYEKPNSFCHRHILAEKLNEDYNLNIKELPESFALRNCV
jgi:uncharacterized protein YeaO (DUF488 family)